MRNPVSSSMSKGLGLVLLAGLCACQIEGTPGGAPKDPFVPPTPGDPYVPEPAAAQARRVVLLHTNDEHSHLLGFAPFSEYPFRPEADGRIDPVEITKRIASDKKTVGGIVRRQHLINKIRAASKDPVLLLSAGDSTMGTVFHAAGASAAPDFVAMGILGYDFVTLGNHEFDWGAANLSESLRTAHRTLFGGAVPVIASNMYFDDVDPTSADADLQKLVGAGNSGAPIQPWATKILPNGLKVGFLGLMGFEAQLVAAGRGNVTFSIPKGGKACTASADCGSGESCMRKTCVALGDPKTGPATVAAMASEVQPLIDLLRNQEKVDVVVALTHLGKSEDLGLATLTSGIDVIIGGHSHDLVAPTIVPSAIKGQTILAQAGEYGRILGELTLVVSPDGKVALAEGSAKQHAVDRSLDAEIAADPAGFERAVTLTGAIIAPVLKGLDAALGPVLGLQLLAQPVSSDADVVGEQPYKDTNLSHLVTDAARGVVMQGACLDPATEKVVAVQANGVIRESLRFDANKKTTVADVFGVLPLGASPFADRSVAAPGFPVVVFRLSLLELFIGADIGVTKGLESDSFFLSYAGMKVEFDRSLPAFDKAKLLKGEDPGGRITKITFDGEATPVFENTAGSTWATRWKADPMTGKVTVITNLYLAGYLDAFGLKPKSADLSATLQLPQTVMCQTMEPTPDCATGKPMMKPCMELSAGQLPYKFLEVKEWGVLLKYLTIALGGQVPAPYHGATVNGPRVVEK